MKLKSLRLENFRVKALLSVKFGHCLTDRVPLPVAESQARRIINLPSSAGLA
jgi:hypothetical protein